MPRHLFARRTQAAALRTGQGGIGPAVLRMAARDRPGSPALPGPAATGSRRRRHLLRPRRTDLRCARPTAEIASGLAAPAPGDSGSVGCRQIIVPARRPVLPDDALRPRLFAVADRQAG